MVRDKKKLIISLIIGCTLLLPGSFVRANELQNIKVGEKYEVEKISYPVAYSVVEYERIELNLKAENINERYILKTKTDSPYEISIAHSDGSYTYVDSANSLEEAKDKIQAIPVQESGDMIIPTIINENGQVVYATKSMGRIWKHIDGKPDQSFNNVTNIYTTKDLTKVHTYINQGYIEDVPVIEDYGNSAKVLVSGNKGWINKDNTAKDYDLVLIPINQVTNPSYYYKKDGLLHHFISSNMTSSTQIGHSIILGPAPSYLEQGVKYLSYDGNYFYNGNNIATALEALITDLETDSTKNSINKDNPYYNYYNYLPFRSRTRYTAEDLNKFINDNTDSDSKLRDMGQAFIDAQEQYGVNALLALGVAINESAWGKSDLALATNNLFGMGANDYFPEGADKFNSPAESINVFAKEYISRGYADPSDWRYYGGFLGNKNFGANVKYASDPYWGEKAAQYGFRIDLFLANNNITKLKDYDAEQLIMYTGSNRVIDSKRNILYNVFDSVIDYGGYAGTVAVTSHMLPREVDGQTLIEINTERHIPVNNGGTTNKYPGEYNWNSKGYILNNNIKYINTKKVSVDDIYVQAYNSTINAVDNADQVSINNARRDINALVALMPNNSSISTWSTILDKVQLEIFKEIVDTMVKLQGKVKKGEKLKQAEVNNLRQLQLNDWNDFTDNIPDEYLKGKNYGWSEQTDLLQNEIINDVVKAVVKAENDKTEASIFEAKEIINDMNTCIDPAMVAWAQGMLLRVEKIEL